MSSSYLFGLVTPDKFQETTATDAEIWRAEQLANREAKPMTGFEIHFLRSLRGSAHPATPKEKALLEEISFDPFDSASRGNSKAHLAADECDAMVTQWWRRLEHFPPDLDTPKDATAKEGYYFDPHDWD